jgi:hypothetical protein
LDALFAWDIDLEMEKRAQLSPHPQKDVAERRRKN